jgi:hypothetical protein
MEKPKSGGGCRSWKKLAREVANVTTSLKDFGEELVWLTYQSQIKAVIYRVTCTLVWEASTRFLQQQKMREHEML